MATKSSSKSRQTLLTEEGTPQQVHVEDIAGGQMNQPAAETERAEAIETIITPGTAVSPIPESKEPEEEDEFSGDEDSDDGNTSIKSVQPPGTSTTEQPHVASSQQMRGTSAILSASTPAPGPFLQPTMFPFGVSSYSVRFNSLLCQGILPYFMLQCIWTFLCAVKFSFSNPAASHSHLSSSDL